MSIRWAPQDKPPRLQAIRKAAAPDVSCDPVAAEFARLASDDGAPRAAVAASAFKAIMATLPGSYGLG